MSLATRKDMAAAIEEVKGLDGFMPAEWYEERLLQVGEGVEFHRPDTLAAAYGALQAIATELLECRRRQHA